MSSTNEDNQIQELMAQIFPGCENFSVDSVTPSITGEEPVISFMVVCNEEAARDFLDNNEISVEVIPDFAENDGGNGPDLHLRFEFVFPLFTLQFFTAVEAANPQQADFISVLSEVDFFVVWLVNTEKKLLKVLKVNWDKAKYREILFKTNR